MATIIFLIDTREIDVKEVQSRKHEICLLIKEDWFDVRYGELIQSTIDEYKNMNPNYSRSDILALCEQIIIDKGATLVPYNSMTIQY